MQRYVGSLIDLALQGHFDVLVHGCNCQHTMGRGIAKTIRDTFPEAYSADLKTPKNDPVKLGTLSTVRVTRAGVSFVIVNAYTQLHYGTHQSQIDYDALSRCFEAVQRDFSGLRIAYPKIGAGLAGGHWPAIASRIDRALVSETHALVSLTPQHRPNYIHSGGQTGADLAGLLAAERLNISTGGWAPKGYRTEKGAQASVLRDRFGLKEHASSHYADRTLANVEASDATVIFARNLESRGTQQTIHYCDRFNKPYLVINPWDLDAEHAFRDFLDTHTPNTLNVAGNRESRAKGLCAQTAALIVRALRPDFSHPAPTSAPEMVLSEGHANSGSLDL